MVLVVLAALEVLLLEVGVVEPYQVVLVVLLLGVEVEVVEPFQEA